MRSQGNGEPVSIMQMVTKSKEVGLVLVKSPCVVGCLAGMITPKEQSWKIGVFNGEPYECLKRLERVHGDVTCNNVPFNELHLLSLSMRR